LIVLAVWALVLNTIRVMRGLKIDWTGVAFMVGFVALAFYLRHVSGMG
jgi:hypothetical protein